MIKRNTPVEEHTLSGVGVLVKREDLCCPPPGPGFSKMRGVFAHIEAREEQTIGALDTFHSHAGWGVSYACKELGRQAVIFWPKYARDPDKKLRKPQRKAKRLGAKLEVLPAGRSSILYHQARKVLVAKYPDSYMIPNALKLKESVEENAIEAEATTEMLDLGRSNELGTLVISVSSGTIAAGVIKGFHTAGADPKMIILHMGYSRSHGELRSYIEMASKVSWDKKGFGLAQRKLESRVVRVDEDYNYKDPARRGPTPPFPCNPYYDLKAWRWLAKTIRDLPSPVLFWNIGA